MRRLACAGLLSAALLITALAAGASAATVGISDQQASTFTNPLYAPLKMSVARYIAPYDVMSEPASTGERAKLDSWMSAARAAHQRILISFEHSRTPHRQGTVPSTSSYRRAITKFKAKFGGQIESVSPWNEVNVCQKGGRTEGQPTRICHATTGAKIVAAYYKQARSVFRGKPIVGLDILDGASSSASAATGYIKRFKRYAKPLPTYWGVHNYSDTNRGSTVRTAKIIRAIGSPKAKIWLTETGGQLHLRTHDYGEATAAKALKCMFFMPKKFRQITRLYVYQFNGVAANHGPDYFDAGLVSFDNVPRLGYAVVQHRQSATCHK